MPEADPGGGIVGHAHTTVWRDDSPRPKHASAGRHFQVRPHDLRAQRQPQRYIRTRETRPRELHHLREIERLHLGCLDIRRDSSPLNAACLPWAGSCKRSGQRQRRLWRVCDACVRTAPAGA
jgi:hypothetical protein